MQIRAAIALLIVIIFGVVVDSQAQAASLAQRIERSLNRINRQLCANFPSSKCKRLKARSGQVNKPKARSAAPVVPSKALPVVPAAPVPAAVPRVAPVLPKLRPANLKSGSALQPDVPVQTKKPTPVVPPPTVAFPAPPVAVVPITPPVLPPQTVAKPAPPVAALPIAPPVLPPPTVAMPVPPVAVQPVVPQVPPSTADESSACLAALAATGTSFVPVPQPATSSACQIDIPVRLNSIATKAGVVKLPGLPIFKCDFALKFSQFVDQRVQPLALQSAGSAVVALGTGPGFDCRGRNGDSTAKMSEHAIGDAVDIVTIGLANKTQILVKDALNVQSPSFAFLRDMRAAACEKFSTVLGPGANAAHAEHFHLDLEVRRGGYRMCE